MLHSTF